MREFKLVFAPQAEIGERPFMLQEGVDEYCESAYETFHDFREMIIKARQEEIAYLRQIVDIILSHEIVEDGYYLVRGVDCDPEELVCKAKNLRVELLRTDIDVPELYALLRFVAGEGTWIHETMLSAIREIADLARRHLI